MPPSVQRPDDRWTSCRRCQASYRSRAAEYHDCATHLRLRSPLRRKRRGANDFTTHTLWAEREVAGALLRLNELGYGTRLGDRFHLTDIADIRFAKPRAIKGGWYVQPSGQNGGRVRNHRRTGKRRGRPPLRPIPKDFTISTVTAELLRETNFSLNELRAVAGTGRPSTADDNTRGDLERDVYTVVVKRKRRPKVVAAALGCSTRSVNRMVKKVSQKSP